MVTPINSNYTNRKGIYKDLYREIDAENNKKKKEEEASLAKKPRKGIYVELYKQIEQGKQKLAFKNNAADNNQNNVYSLALKKLINDIASKVSYCFSSATREIKMLIVALMVAKKPINSYIENYTVGQEIPTYNRASN